MASAALSKRSPSSLLKVENPLSMAALSQQLPRRLMLQVMPCCSRRLW